MADTSASAEAGRRPVIYAGRFADQTNGADLPNDCVVLGERDALGVLDRASTLTFLDLPSFPIEALTGAHWDVPMVVVLPPGSDTGSLIATFGPSLFERLGFFDRIVTPDTDLWEKLRRKYRWGESQRVVATGDHPGEVARAVLALLEAEAASPTAPETMGITGKAMHRVQTAALEPRFVAAREDRDTSTPLDVLEVGTGAGRWASSFDPEMTRFVGLDAREDLLAAARANFPEGRFDLLGADLLFPYEDESFDLVFSVAVMHHNPVPAKRTLLSEMWRVSRPGGRLLFLEDLVFTSQPEDPNVHPTSVTEFVDLILDATAGQVVLEHVESLRYPHEDLHRGGLISLLRLGARRT
jgi:ubiquinone/menaquinone biosynthesis C-methylase UbiE